MQGLLDFITGGGEYADPNNIDPRYGVPMNDVRQAAINSISNMGALLLAGGQPMPSSQRAQYLAQLGQASSGFNTDLYNSAQRRLMQAQFQTKMDDLKEDQQIRTEMKDAAGFKSRYGFDPTGMRPEDVRAARRTMATRDPQEALLRGLSILKTQRELSQPTVREVNGGLAVYNDETKRYDWVLPPKPQGGLEGEAQSLIIAATKDPTIAETPEYSVAFNRMYGPKLVQAFNPATQQMEYTYSTPPLPPGVVAPRQRAQPGGAPDAAQTPAQPAPAPGTTAPLISQRPQEEKPLTEDQGKATGFARRMIEASKIIDPLDFTDAAKPGALEMFLGPKIGDVGANYLRSDDRQLYRQAQENWVRANLRKESGAVIGADEMRKEIENYFPQPGDTPQVIEQKRKSREAAMEGMIVQSGPGAKRAGLQFKPYEPPVSDRIKAMGVQDLLTLDISGLDDRTKAAYYARLRELNRGR